MSRNFPSPPAVEYPSSDGKPMAENDAQRAAIMHAVGVRRIRFAHRLGVCVSEDLQVCHEKGNPRASAAPGAFVVFGVEDRPRGTDLT